jgi:endonuclease/exonuclease/phosphatase family metal-dependent hydrolase
VFRVVSWNLQFCAGRGRRFFFDGGPDVWVTPHEVEDTLAGITRLLRSLSPDIALLQEVDRGSSRTAGIDQHPRLVAALGLPVACTAAYHQSGWVPHPPHRHMGRVDMHLATLSRFGLSAGRRHALPLLAEGWLRQQFNLRRALLEVAVPTDDGGAFTALNTHLSAFSYGDGTLHRQVAALEARLADQPDGRWLLGGDFNALPPSDPVHRLGEDAIFYPELDPPIAPLFRRFAAAKAADELLDPRWWTWVPWGSNVPDRAIDYLFHGDRVEVLDYRVIGEGARWSDHLPLVADLRILKN